jgi:AcrR family transcriptional regulator
MEKSRPPWRPTPGSAESSERTRVNILWAAQRVLATDGYAQFTTRAVAAAAGIKPGNLAYHYKTKRELLRAVISAMIAEYARQIEDLFKNHRAEPKDGFAELVAWLIHDSTTSNTSRLFRELWAMAVHDPFIAKAIDGLYDVSFARMAELLRQSQPGLSVKRATEIVWLLGMICEGANPIFGTTKRKGAPVSRVTTLAIEALVRLAKEPEGA